VTCSAARFLLIAGFVGVAASSLSGNDLVGLLAAAVAMLGLLAFERLGRGRPTARSCPLPRTSAHLDVSPPARTSEDRSSQPG
jgi:hypothetical protein